MEQFLIAVASAIVGALVSYGITEPRRRRERREDETRHQAELAAARADVRASEQRELDLDAIVQTRRQMAAMLADLAAIVAGEGASKPGRYGADVYPRANIPLVGDPKAIEAYLNVATDLYQRAPDSSLTLRDVEAIASAENAIRSALDAQEARVLRGEPLRTMTPEEHASLTAAYACHLTARRPPAHDPPGR
jgi:hypothetical protein